MKLPRDIRRALLLPCPQRGCLASPGVRCPTVPRNVHRARQDLANALTTAAKTRNPEATPTPTRKGCFCRNHLGKPKTRHRDKPTAMVWATINPRVAGMRTEFYPCPSGKGWHVRTVKETND